VKRYAVFNWVLFLQQKTLICDFYAVYKKSKLPRWQVFRPTLNKQLQYFIQPRIVEWSYSQIRIIDMQRLKQMS